jgi:deoxyribodipyrimidine photolyase-related protein
MVRIYANWDRMDPEVRDAYRGSAAAFLESLKSAQDGWARAPKR